MPFALKTQRLLTPTGLRPGAVLVDGATIRAVVTPADIPEGMPVEDVGAAVVMAGGVDAHVHINAPGRTHWEGFETATRAAAAGGMTTLLDMPLNSTPVTTTPEALALKRAEAEGKLRVDVGFYGGLVPGNAQQVAALIDAGVRGIKAFLVHAGIDDFPNATEADLHAALPVLAERGVPLLVHAELAGPAPPTGDPCSYAAYLASRPRAWEQQALRLMVDLCRRYRAPIHIVHLSDADAVPMLRAARDEGLPLTVETCPHYLHFTAEAIEAGDTRFKCAPPIRARENQERLWEALTEGIIDFIASDHSPCPPRLKHLDTGDFTQAWGGIASLQLTLPIVWTEMKRRGHRLEYLAPWLSARPAERFGLVGRKGRLAPGYDADLVVWNPEAPFTVTEAVLHHRHKLTPYAGETLFGHVEKTYLRGQVVYDGGFPPPRGEEIVLGY